MTEDERAAQVLEGPGTPADSKNFICIGCGEKLTIEIPGKPFGVYGTVLLFNEHGVSAPVAIWGHEKGKCVGSPLLKALRGETSEVPETPEPADEGETIPATLMGRKRKGVTPEAEALTGAPASEREPEAVSN